jgi:hypothetical protein
MCFIIGRCLRQFAACHFRGDVCSRARLPCVGSLKREVRALALLAVVYEVSVLRLDSTGSCTQTG